MHAQDPVNRIMTEAVLSAERSLNVGQDEHLHAALLKAVRAVRVTDRGAGGEPPAPLGLGV